MPSGYSSTVTLRPVQTVGRNGGVRRRQSWCDQHPHCRKRARAREHSPESHDCPSFRRRPPAPRSPPHALGSTTRNCVCPRRPPRRARRQRRRTIAGRVRSATTPDTTITLRRVAAGEIGEPPGHPDPSVSVVGRPDDGESRSHGDPARDHRHGLAPSPADRPPLGHCSSSRAERCISNDLGHRPPTAASSVGRGARRRLRSAVVEGMERSGDGDAGVGPSDVERSPACSSSDPDRMPSPDDGGAAGRRSGARWSRPDTAARSAERWRSRVLPAPATTAHADPAVVAGGPGCQATRIVTVSLLTSTKPPCDVEVAGPCRPAR